VKAWLKRVLPEWLKYVIYRFLWDPVRRWVWGSLKLRNTLPGGITVWVKDYSDWVIYNEVTVNREYDPVIHAVLDKGAANDPIHVVDLGANVGYFSFHFADLFIQRRGSADGLELTLVEGSPAVFRELQRRIAEEPLLANRTSTIHGLVGKRAGGDYISQSYIHYGHGASQQRSFGAKWVPYVDLQKVLGDIDHIDLLKCDIEGSEFELIENYPALFNKLSTAVFEFHDYGRDVNSYRAKLEAYGFRRDRVLRATSRFSVEYYVRLEKWDVVHPYQPFGHRAPMSQL
jgi:FkbM family methyltransferase